jgi:hypothetical protein
VFWAVHRSQDHVFASSGGGACKRERSKRDRRARVQCSPGHPVLGRPRASIPRCFRSLHSAPTYPSRLARAELRVPTHTVNTASCQSDPPWSGRAPGERAHHPRLCHLGARPRDRLANPRADGRWSRDSPLACRGQGAGLLRESAVIDPDTKPRTVTQGERVSLSSGQHRGCPRCGPRRVRHSPGPCPRKYRLRRRRP